ncbi:MAG: sigma-E factor negative regulatory protein RseC [Deferribacteres bacterium]|jgi:positive regulator of sigma E activity|nr:positive regulator of sigma RseC/MucC [Deferribacteraceae bacterium]MDK2791820.1 sigma-E factor negative regulatory protein RseC [Deferribacteres bacterium]
MSQKITHRGKVVKKVDKNKYLVEVLPMSACSSCSMSGGCHGASESSQKTFTVVSDRDIQVSSEVIISLTKKNLLFSIFTAYILPVVLMLVIALITDKLIGRDIVTAILSLAVLGIYFIILKFFLKGNSKLNVSIEKVEGGV